MTNTRPTIDFGAASQKARDNAAAANSRILPPPSQKILKAAASGDTVDAYDLNKAVMHAMRAATTRHGQSMGRRSLAIKIQYLANVTQDALNKHADAIAVAAGDDAPITALRGELAHARSDLSEAMQTIRVMGAAHDRETADLTRALMDAHADNDRLQGRLADLSNRADEIQAEVDGQFANAVATRNRLSKALDYATALLTFDKQQRVKGYLDGLGDA